MPEISIDECIEQYRRERDIVPTPEEASVLVRIERAEGLEEAARTWDVWRQDSYIKREALKWVH